MVAFGFATAVSAVTVTWDGDAGTGAWGTGANWSSGSVPANADNLIFDAAAANNQFAISLGGSRTTLGIVFNSTGSSGFTFNDASARTLTINGSGLVNNNANTQSFGSNLTVAVNAGQTWDAASGGFSFAGTVNMNNALSLAGSGAFLFSGTTNVSAALSIGGSGSRTFSGTTNFLNNVSLSGSGLVSFSGTVVNNAGNRTFTNSGTGGATINNVNLSQNNTGRTLTFAGTGTTTIQGTLANGGTTAGNILKSGTGTLILAGTNSFTGTTTVSQGTLELDSNLTGTGTITVNDANTGTATTSLLIGADGVTVSRAITVANNGNGTTLGGNLASGAGTISSTVTLNRAVNLTADGTSNITFSGAISGASGITKVGTGTVTLSGDNGYLGGSNLSAGTLVANHANALSTSGTVRFTGGVLSYGSGITTDYSARIANSTGAIAIDSNGNNVTFATALANTNVGGLTKSGSGTLTLSGNNAYTGTTTLAGGTLLANHANALGTSGNVTFTGGTLTYGTGITTDYSARIANSTGAMAINTNGNNVTFASALANTNTGGLAKSGSGTLTLSSANSYSGGTTLSGGTINLRNSTAAGSGTISVGSGTTLELENVGSTVVTTNAITINNGTLRNVSGDANQFAGNITLAGAATINSATAGQALWIGAFNGGPTGTTDLALGSNTLTVSGPGNVTFLANVGVSGDGGNFVSNSTGTVRFFGYTNYYTGSTTVNSGTLIIDTDPNSLYNNQTIRGNLTIGNGSTAATVTFANTSLDNRIADTSAITINSGSTLDLNNNFDTVGALNLTAASITLGNEGTLQLTGNVTVNAGTSTLTGYQFSMTTDASTRTFDIASGGILDIAAQVTTGHLNKTGAGTMILTGNNIYTGTTTVGDGILNIRNNTALGATTNGTTVTSGGELQLQRDAAYNSGNSLTISSEALTLNGIGDTGETGALRNISGQNTWTGTITLGSTARINSDVSVYDPDGAGPLGNVSSSLTISGGVVLAGNQLKVGGEADTTISGVISNGSGTGTLYKDGNGTLTLTGSNNYQGTTSITDGVVNIRNNDALGSTLAGTTVDSGAALQIQNSITVGAEALTLNGTGVSNDGALRNISGTNTYGGLVTVNSATARINSDAGTLTLSGGAALGSNALTVGGAGNTTISGQLTSTAGASTLTKDGTGTLTLSNGTNTFSGDVSITAGTLALGANSALNSSSIDVTVGASGTLSLVSYAQSLGTISGTGLIDFGTGGKITLASSSTYSGTFSGTGEIVVSAGTTLTLGANFNAAGVTITLAGGTLNLNGKTSTFAGLNLTADSTINFSGNSTVTFSTLTPNSSILSVSNWTDTQDYFLWDTSSNPTRYNYPLNQITFGPSGGPPWTTSNTTWNSWDKQVTPVPEPSTYGAMLIGAGLCVFGYRRWRKNLSRGDASRLPTDRA